VPPAELKRRFGNDGERAEFFSFHREFGWVEALFLRSQGSRGFIPAMEGVPVWRGDSSIGV